MEKGVVWDISFLRNLTGIETDDFVRLLGCLDRYYLSGGKSDVGLWKPDIRGHFSVKSFYKVLSASDVRMEGWHNFWVSYVPPRVLAFCWVAKKQKILTIDNLRKRNHVIINGCPLCLRDEESVHHLTIHCFFAYRVWIVFINLFDVN